MFLRRAIGLLAPLLLAASTSGCLTSSYVSIADARAECEKNPAAYDALEPLEIAGDDTGRRLERGEAGAAVVVRIERRACMFRVQVQTPKGSTSFGPYEQVYESDIQIAAGGRYSFLVHPNSADVRAVIDGVAGEPHKTLQKPLFSQNGAHVAYFAQDGESTTVWADGKTLAQGRGAGAPEQLFGIMDDGRPAYSVKSADGRSQLVLGSWTSSPYDSMSSYGIWQSRRFTAFLQHGTEWELVLDDRRERITGSPASGVLFSPDGAHAMYVAYRGDTSERRYEVVLDGVTYPLPSNGRKDAPTVVLQGSIPVMYIYPPPPPPAPPMAANPDSPVPSPPRANSETGFLVVGQSAPALAASRDAFGDAHRGRDGYYVQIGGSRGPQLDAIEMETLRIDEQGHVRYRGRRGSDVLEVVDNVIQKLPLVSAAPSLKVPGAAVQIAAPTAASAPHE